MVGVRPRLSNAGPATYPVVEAVKGGQLVEARVGGVGVAAAGSLKVVGVANIDARPFQNPVTTDGDGFETINISPLPQETTCSFERFVVTYAADAAFGDSLVAASLGRVTPAAPGVDPRAIVGFCDELNGVVVASNPKGLAYISR